MSPKRNSLPWVIALACLAGCSVLGPTIPQRQFLNTTDHPVPEQQFAREPEVSLAGPEFPDHVEAPAEEEAPAVAPRSRIGGAEPVSLELRGTSLGQALHLIAELGKVNIYLEQGLDRPVDASFPSVQLDDALSVLLARNGMRMREEPAGIFWVEVADGSESSVGRFKVQSIDAAEIQPQLVAMVSQDTQVIVDGPQNLILVKGARRDVEFVRQYLKDADRLKRQVLIEVRIVEASLNDSFQLGISGLANGTLGSDALNLTQALGTPDQSFALQLTASSVDATLQAISRFVGIQLVSAPKVLAVTGTQAMIEVIEEIPYVNTTTTTTGTTGGTGSQVVQEVLFKEAGIKLTVTPTVQEHGVLQIKIDQEFSEVTGTFNGIPVLDSRKLASTFLVPDKGTLVLGGLLQKRREQADKGIPVLMHFPLVGRLFRSDDDSGKQRELLVFITPRILDFDEARELAGRYQARFEDRQQAIGLDSANPHAPRNPR